MPKKLKTVAVKYTGMNTTLERQMKIAAGRWPTFTAYGFRHNDRHLSWDCPSESAAKTLRAKLNKIKSEGLTVELKRD